MQIGDKVYIVIHCAPDFQFVHEVYSNINDAIKEADSMNAALKVCDGTDGHTFTIDTRTLK